jgi:hypothetical protein
MAIKNLPHVPIPGWHECRWTAACTNETHRNGTACTADCRHLISVWNQHRPKPFPCGRVILPVRNFTVMAFKEVHDCKIYIDFGNWKSPALYDCSIKEYSDKSFKDRLWGEVCEAVVSEWSQLDGPEKRKKGKQCCFSMYLIQMHRFTLICCKIQICLTLQRKWTLAESYDFLVVVNKGQYFSRVCQVLNYTLSYCQGTASCGDVKYLVK